MFSISKTTVKMLILAAVTVAGAIQVGCTNREIASGVIGAVLVDSIYRSNPPPPPRHSRETCYVERRRDCRTTADYWGNPIRSCDYYNWNSCTGWRKAAVGSTSAADLDVAAIGQTYQLTSDGANTFVTALTEAQNASDEAGAAAAFAKLNINVEEAKSLGTSGEASPEMIDRLAKALNQSPTLTKAMVASIAETARDQQAARQNSNQ